MSREMSGKEFERRVTRVSKVGVDAAERSIRRAAGADMALSNWSRRTQAKIRVKARIASGGGRIVVAGVGRGVASARAVRSALAAALDRIHAM
jgi:D-arabinose 5-phosphate isomerase GutQ